MTAPVAPRWGSGSYAGPVPVGVVTVVAIAHRSGLPGCSGSILSKSATVGVVSLHSSSLSIMGASTSS